MKVKGWRWIDKRLLLILHDESLAEHGGASGLRDEGLLDSALAGPLNLLAYGGPDAADLAASYGFGLAKNHAFVDGNKAGRFFVGGPVPGIERLSPQRLSSRCHLDRAVGRAG